MCSSIVLSAVVAAMFLSFGTCEIETLHDHHSHEPQMMMSHSASDDRHHIGQHMGDVVDIDDMAEDELRFLYFKMHDSDDNNMLDGCELIKSLLHFHVEECKAMGPEHAHHGTTKVFGHDELSLMIDPILSTDDRNLDGFIDYPEFIAAQKSRGF